MLAINKSGARAGCSNTDGPRGHHARGDKVTQRMTISGDITYMWTHTNKLMNKMEIDHRRQKTTTHQGEWGGGESGE